MSATTDEVSTHTLTAAVCTKQTRADIATRAASARRGVKASTVVLCVEIKLFSGVFVFVVIGVHSAGCIKKSLSIDKISSLYAYATHKEVPFCISVSVGDTVKQSLGFVYVIHIDALTYA